MITNLRMAYGPLFQALLNIKYLKYYAPSTLELILRTLLHALEPSIFIALHSMSNLININTTNNFEVDNNKICIR